MEWWVGLGILGLVALGWFAQRRGWIDLSDKTRKGAGGSGSGGIVGIGDEVFAPRKYEAQVEMDRQSLLPAPAPLPGDGDKGIAFADESVGSAESGQPDETDEADGRTDRARFNGSIRLDIDPPQ